MHLCFYIYYVCIFGNVWCFDKFMLYGFSQIYLWEIFEFRLMLPSSKLNKLKKEGVE